MAELILNGIAILVIGGVMYYMLNRVAPELAKYLDAKAEEMRLHTTDERCRAYEQGFTDATERYVEEGDRE